jgi:uridine phosphorylase
VSSQYHIALDRGDVGRYVLLPGDPGRSARIAASFDDARQVAANREYITYTGTLLGEPVSVTSTGIGSPSTAIAVEELAAIGAETLVRVGTAGATQNYLRTGALVVAQAAVRDEGTTRHYVPLAYPAVADLAVVDALCRAAQRLGFSAYTGIVRSTDGLYADLSPHTMPVQALRKGTPDNVWAQSNVLCAEMEAAALFVVASLRGLRAGCVLSIVNEIGGGDIPPGAASALEPLIATAVEALRLLIRRDRGEADGS